MNPLPDHIKKGKPNRGRKLIEENTRLNKQLEDALKMIRELRDKVAELKAILEIG